METFDKSRLQESDSTCSSSPSSTEPGDMRKPETKSALFTRGRQAIYGWLTANTFSPFWMPERWSHPAIGYLVALLLQVVAVFTMNGIVQMLPSFRFPEALVILGVLIVSLGWGVGPGILATLAGGLLMIFLIFPPYFSFALAKQEDSAAVGLFMVVGLAISIMAGQTERARRTSEHLRMRLDTIIDVIPDALTIYDAQGKRTRVNPAARDLLGGQGQLPYLTDEALRLRHVRALTGEALKLEETPIMRALHGEPVQELETRFRDTQQREHIVTTTAVPLYGSPGTIEGAVMISHDITAMRESERAAVENASQLEALFETMVDAVVVYDNAGRFVRMNSAARQLLGIDAQPDYVSQNLSERMERVLLRDGEGNVVPEEQWPHYRILGGEILTGANTVDLTIRAMDGVGRQVNLSGAPVRNAEGEIVGAVCIVRDVTWRRQLERELAARAQELETIFDTMNDGVCVYDSSGRVLRANRAARVLLDIDARPAHFYEQPVAERSTMYTMYDAQGRVLPIEEGPVLRVLSGENLYINAFDMQIDQPGGRTVYLNVSGAPLRDEHDAVIGAVCVYRDLSERRQLEQRTQETLNALLTIAEAFIATEDATDIEQTEEATRRLAFRLTDLACRALGCSEGSMSQLLPGTDVTHLLASVGLSEKQRHAIRHMVNGTHLRERYASQETFERLSAGEVVEIDLTRPPHRDRRPNTRVSWSLVLPLRQHERLIGIIALSSIDASRKLSPEEMALAQAVAKFAVMVIERAQLMRERADAQAQALALQVANQRMDAFLGIASHELKTPLTTIKGNLQLAQRNMKRWLRDGLIQDTTLRRRFDNVQQMLERAERQVGVQNRLVSDLLDVSRIQANKLEIRPEPCDLIDIVNAAVEDQRYAAETRTIIVEESVASIPLIADADRIGQVVSNYLTNALKYSPEDAPVTVKVQVQGQLARVSVHDEGPGLPPAEQEHIWERFYRAQGIEVQSGSGVGLGLGLHICRTIIEQHHGNVGVISEQGKDSTFWFTLLLEH